MPTIPVSHLRVAPMNMGLAHRMCCINTWQPADSLLPPCTAEWQALEWAPRTHRSPELPLWSGTSGQAWAGTSHLWCRKMLTMRKTSQRGTIPGIPPSTSSWICPERGTQSSTHTEHRLTSQDFPLCWDLLFYYVLSFCSFKIIMAFI